jgi:hypothetical protein
MSVISDKNQVTLPVEALRAAGLKPGDDVLVEVQVTVDEFAETVVWPNGADLDPDVLYGTAEPASGPAPRISIPKRA